MDEGAPGLSEIMRHFTLDVPWILALAGAAGLYLYAFRKSRASGRQNKHPMWRLSLYMTGLFCMAIAVLSPLEYYGNQVLWINFLGFLVIIMIAAPLILLGSPLTLAFRVSGPLASRRLRAFYRSTPMRLLTFPVVSGLLFAVVTYIWQFSGWLELASENWLVRDVQQATLLLVSFIFWLPALASDPLRWRMPHPLRVLYVLVEMVHKSLFGAMFLSMSRPFHKDLAANLPAWAPSPMMDQRIALLILWVGGNLIFLLALVGLLAGWVNYEHRNDRRVDRRIAAANEARRKRQEALDKVFTRSV